MKFETYNCGDENIVIPVAQTFADGLTLCKSDQYRLTGRKTGSARILLKALLTPLSVSSYLVWFRMASVPGVMSLPFAVLHKIAGSYRHIYLSRHTRIGFGLFLAHGLDIVISPHTVIGNNVNLSQFLNIGSNHNTAAVIGNSVYVGPMCCIVENVAIGSNAVIGAGAVVTKPVPPGTTAAGVPAKVINPRSESFIMHPYRKD